jgi:hypothetical protein
MLSHPDPDPYTWLTVPEILADLDVSLQDWQEWEATGQTPTGVVFPDGQVRISQLAYSRWLDSLPADDGLPLDTPEQIRDTLRYALRLAGKRGMSRAELGELFGDYITPEDLDTGLQTLIKAGICLTGPGENCRAIHYRLWGAK